jgi:nucleotide-binding universal stress UspA family protein
VFRNILVGTDGSDTAMLAVKHAVHLAGLLEAQVTVVSAHRPDGRAIALALLRDVEAVHGARAHLRTRAVQGAAAEVLVSLAVEGGFDLVVVGNRGMDRAAWIPGASVPDRVSHRASTSVLVVDTMHGRPPGWSRVLVGTDGSPSAGAGVELAHELSSLVGAEMTVAAVGASRRTGNRMLQPLLRRFPGTSGVVLSGSPTAALCDLAESRSYDLVVLGSRGVAGPTRLWGGVPVRVAHRARTSVLIVQSAGHRRAGPRPGKGAAHGERRG